MARRIHESIEIEVPVETSFDFVADFNNALKWMHGFNAFQLLTEISFGVGAKVRASGKIRGIPVSTELEIIDFLRPEKLISKSTGIVNSTSAWLFDPTKKGCRVTFWGDYEMPKSALQDIISVLWLNRELADYAWKSLKNLKYVLENKPNF